MILGPLWTGSHSRLVCYSQILGDSCVRCLTNLDTVASAGLLHRPPLSRRGTLPGVRRGMSFVENSFPRERGKAREGGKHTLDGALSKVA